RTEAHVVSHAIGQSSRRCLGGEVLPCEASRSNTFPRVSTARRTGRTIQANSSSQSDVVVNRPVPRHCVTESVVRPFRFGVNVRTATSAEQWAGKARQV